MFLEIEYKLQTGVVHRKTLNVNNIIEITKEADGLAVVHTDTGRYFLTERYAHIVDRLGINIVEFKK